MPSDEPARPPEKLSTPIQFLRGVGPQRAELLAKLGLTTACDVLFNFPRDYQDFSDLRPISDLTDDKFLSVRGRIEEIDLRNSGIGRNVLGVLLRQGQNYLRALWFNQPYMRDKFRVGEEVIFSARPQFRGGRWEMHHPRIQPVDTGEPSAPAPWSPIYALTEGLNQNQLRSVSRSTLDSFRHLVADVLPDTFLTEHDLWPIQTALEQIHFPADQASLERARRRFVFQELLVLQLALAIKRQQQTARQAPKLEASARIDSRIRRLFPFEFTAGQQQAISEVSADLARPSPMNRLLQGDVGSGKTVVALYAVLVAVANGHQAAIMAPTEILARQHADTLGGVLSQSQVKFALLTGSQTARERRQLLLEIASGQVQVVIGTQAIVSADVEFPKLGLVVIDEQHKFGVQQRARLKKSGLNPHYLVMTATPIPRTLTMTVFGDLDVSTIRELPAGRQSVHTYWVQPDDRGRWWEFVRKKLREGRQAYVISPLVEDSEHIAVSSLQATFESLANGELADFRLGMIHGQMIAAEKLAAMEAFRGGNTQVLLATSIIEVGIDVPNATLMTIEDGHQFGLAQLHQLRGRITRGTHPSFCAVFGAAKTDDAAARLTAFARSTDGFELAEIDAELRGPGDLLGIRQHGLPAMRIADLARDVETGIQIRSVAQALIQNETIDSEAFKKLKQMVIARYGKSLSLADVG